MAALDNGERYAYYEGRAKPAAAPGALGHVGDVPENQVRKPFRVAARQAEDAASTGRPDFLDRRNRTVVV